MAATGTAVAMGAAAVAGLTLAGFASAASQGRIDHKNGIVNMAPAPAAPAPAAPAPAAAQATEAPVAVAPAEAPSAAAPAPSAAEAPLPPAAAAPAAPAEAAPAAPVSAAEAQPPEQDPITIIVDDAIKKAEAEEVIAAAGLERLLASNKAATAKRYGGKRVTRRRMRGGDRLLDALKALGLDSPSPRPAFMKLITVPNDKVATRLIPIFKTFINWRQSIVGLRITVPDIHQKGFADHLLDDVAEKWSSINPVFKRLSPISEYAAKGEELINRADVIRLEEIGAATEAEKVRAAKAAETAGEEMRIRDAAAAVRLAEFRAEQAKAAAETEAGIAAKEAAYQRDKALAAPAAEPAPAAAPAQSVSELDQLRAEATQRAAVAEAAAPVAAQAAQAAAEAQAPVAAATPGMDQAPAPVAEQVAEQVAAAAPAAPAQAPVPVAAEAQAPVPAPVANPILGTPEFLNPAVDMLVKRPHSYTYSKLEDIYHEKVDDRLKEIGAYDRVRAAIAAEAPTEVAQDQTVNLQSAAPPLEVSMARDAKLAENARLADLQSQAAHNRATALAAAFESPAPSRPSSADFAARLAAAKAKFEEMQANTAKLERKVKISKLPAIRSIKKRKITEGDLKAHYESLQPKQSVLEEQKKARERRAKIRRGSVASVPGISDAELAELETDLATAEQTANEFKALLDSLILDSSAPKEWVMTAELELELQFDYLSQVEANLAAVPEPLLAAHSALGLPLPPATRRRLAREAPANPLGFGKSTPRGKGGRRTKKPRNSTFRRSRKH